MELPKLLCKQRIELTYTNGSHTFSVLGALSVSGFIPRRSKSENTPIVVSLENLEYLLAPVNYGAYFLASPSWHLAHHARKMHS